MESSDKHVFRKSDNDMQSTGWRWLLEPEVMLLVLLVLGIYFSRIGAVTLRGEETRRAWVAIEMIESGNWVVPNVQGILLQGRPPLQNWAIAVTGFIRGQVDVVSARLPSAIATLLTALLIYGFSRGFLSAAGSLLAGAAYATMGQVLQLAQTAETEALFTFFISGSLLMWFWGYSRKWHPAATWGIAYSFVALGTLTKGPQAPVYFAGAVGVTLLASRQWRFAFSRWHVFGLMVFLTLWFPWNYLFYSQKGWYELTQMYFRDVGDSERFGHWYSQLGPLLTHFFVFPVKVLVCLLPWSGLLLVYLFPGFRKSIGAARPEVLFLAGCILVALPTCLIIPTAKTRFFMPLFPCFAPLIGLAAERTWNSSCALHWEKAWFRFAVVLSVLMGIATIIFAGIAFSATEEMVTWQPPLFLTMYCVVGIGLAVIAMQSRKAATNNQCRAGVFAIAAFFGLTSAGVVMDIILNDSTNPEAQMAEVRSLLPNDAKLVSLGWIDHRFLFYFGEPIETVPGPVWEYVRELPEDVSYFCFTPGMSVTAEQLQFPWEEITVVSCSSSRNSKNTDVVVIGRRLESHSSPPARRIAAEHLNPEH